MGLLEELVFLALLRASSQKELSIRVGAGFARRSASLAALCLILQSKHVAFSRLRLLSTMFGQY